MCLLYDNLDKNEVAESVGGICISVLCIHYTEYTFLADADNGGTIKEFVVNLECFNTCCFMGLFVNFFGQFILLRQTTMKLRIYVKDWKIALARDRTAAAT